MADFVHGVVSSISDNSTRSISAVATSVIGIVGTAGWADPAKFPVNTPVLVNDVTQLAGLISNKPTKETDPPITQGSLPDALNLMFDQANLTCVVIRVDEGADDKTTQTNIIGGVNGSGHRTGMQVLIDAQSVLGLTPKILCVPSFSKIVDVASALCTLTDEMDAFCYLDGPGSSASDAIKILTAESSPLTGYNNAMLCDPWIKAAGVADMIPPSALWAAIRAKTDNEKGVWRSSSNQKVNSVIGTSYPVEYANNPSSTSNLLNGAGVACIVNYGGGFRTWGNYTCAFKTDSQFAFEPARRVASMISDTLDETLMWAVDLPTNASYFNNVTASINGFMRDLSLQSDSAVNGTCTANKDLNTETALDQGQSYFDIDFSVASPAQTINCKLTKQLQSTSSSNS
ncbi:phage tail sheath subtilisin-like domain-containing protein [Piscirickettsia litoralis]|uniref:Tail sheath protein subtilisin-like domain-containing protein n=1 Tax=Piscirickettsia litoralis TaxID=1891921 RepID=A0ABX3A4X0_9GAMM|nr:phage tail sheath subtilisin-like domain-containing protein [Piscirickettsia litoralis]ODN41159.1 hypothetical protein BGC07_17960 [Piscirickettsia litoralis]